MIKISQPTLSGRVGSEKFGRKGNWKPSKIKVTFHYNNMRYNQKFKYNEKIGIQIKEVYYCRMSDDGDDSGGDGDWESRRSVIGQGGRAKA